MHSRQGDLVRLVARRISEARVERGLTQESLASRLDIATKNLQRIESGRQNLTLRTIERVAGALDIDAGHLLGPEIQIARRSVLSALVDAGHATVPAAQPRQRSREGIPVLDLVAAAGSFGEPRAADIVGWTVVDRRRTPPAGAFVAEVRGASMAPRIPDGAVCLFGPSGPLTEGRIVLVGAGAVLSSDLGGSYALKKVGRIHELGEHGATVVLHSLNPAYGPLTVHASGPEELRVIGEFMEILARV